MTGDRAVGWAAVFVAGWLAGSWNPDREVQQVKPQPCAKIAYATLPTTPAAARRWAKTYVDSRRDGVILK